MEKVCAMLKGGGGGGVRKSCEVVFRTGALHFSHTDRGGGRKMFPSLKKGGGGAKVLPCFEFVVCVSVCVGGGGGGQICDFPIL